MTPEASDSAVPLYDVTPEETAFVFALMMLDSPLVAQAVEEILSHPEELSL